MRNFPLLLRRLAAITYDLMIITAILIVATAAALLLTGGEAVMAGTRWFQFYIAAIILAYFTISWWRRGQTIGMIAWRLKLRTGDNHSLAFFRCVLRALLAIISMLPLGLGFIWVLFDERARSWHDILSGTILDQEKRPNESGQEPPR